MHEGTGRIAGGLILLIGLWLGVYWWWAHESKITFAQAEEAVPGVAPKKEPAPKPPELPPTPTPESGGHQATPVVIEPKHSGAEPAKEQPKDAPQAIIPPEFTDYTVKDGDTFTSIARHYYGIDALASAIIAANPLMSPDHLKPGRVIKIPKDPNNVQGIPVKQATPAPQTPLTPPTPPAPAHPAGARTYVVQPGDSLSKIAKEVST